MHMHVVLFLQSPLNQVPISFFDLKNGFWNSYKYIWTKLAL